MRRYLSVIRCIFLLGTIIFWRWFPVVGRCLSVIRYIFLPRDHIFGDGFQLCAGVYQSYVFFLPRDHIFGDFFSSCGQVFVSHTNYFFFGLETIFLGDGFRLCMYTKYFFFLMAIFLVIISGCVHVFGTNTKE